MSGTQTALGEQRGAWLRRPMSWRLRYRVMPWWVKVLAVFVASRLVTTAIFLWFAANQAGVPGWVSAHPGYFEYASVWDGGWYQRIAEFGYPATLPVDATGHVQQNAWAFMPLYPFLVAVLSTVTTVPWTVMAPIVSLLFGAGTVLLLHRLLQPMIGSGAALFAVVLYCVAPVSPLLQVSYAESMQCFLIVLGLLLLVRRRYGWLFPVIAATALTRPTGLAFALALGLLWLYRLWRRRSEAFTVREAALLGSATVFSGLMGLAWPALAWLVTGLHDAYVQTELSWRVGYIGWTELQPFTAWFQSADWWLSGSPLAPFVVIALIVAFGLCFLLRPVRALAIELRMWIAAYGIYLLAVFFPQSSVFRLLMPFFPALGALAVPRSRVYRVALVLLGVAGQFGWMYIAWSFQWPDWTPP